MMNWIKIRMLRTAAWIHDWRWHRTQKKIVAKFGMDCEKLRERRQYHSIMSQLLNAIADSKEAKAKEARAKKMVCQSCSQGSMPECGICEEGNP